MEIKIEKASIRDLDHILDIEKLSFPYPWSKEMIEPMLLKFLVAKNHKGRIVGFLAVETVLDETHILHTAVHPNFRRKKIASLLVKYVLKDPSRKYILEVRENNLAAKGLYKKFGFKVASKRKEYYKENNEDALVMIYERS